MTRWFTLFCGVFRRYRDEFIQMCMLKQINRRLIFNYLRNRDFNISATLFLFCDCSNTFMKRKYCLTRHKTKKVKNRFKKKAVGEIALSCGSCLLGNKCCRIYAILEKKYCRKQNIAGLSILITKTSYSMNSSQNKLCTLSKKQMLIKTVSW